MIEPISTSTAESIRRAIGRLDEAVGILEGLDTEVVEDIEEDLEAMRNSSKRLDAYVAAVPAVQPAQDESA